MTKKKSTKAVALLSGGMDSTTLLFQVLTIHEHVHAVIFDYNQRHRKEIQHATNICGSKNIPYSIINISIPSIEGSPLIDINTDVPSQSEKIQSSTVVPLRNSFFLLQACIIAIKQSASEVYIGAVEDDQLSYPDCRPEFFEAFQRLLDIQELENKITIHYPFVKLSKSKILKLGLTLNVPFDKTWTCYKGLDKACGKCDACKERLDAFKANNLTDPLDYMED